MYTFSIDSAKTVPKRRGGGLIRNEEFGIWNGGDGCFLYEGRMPSLRWGCGWRGELCEGRMPSPRVALAPGCGLGGYGKGAAFEGGSFGKNMN